MILTILIIIFIVAIVAIIGFLYWNKKEMAATIIGVASLATIAVLMPAPIGEPWIIDGNMVYVNDSKAFISAEPAFLEGPGWVEFTLESKQYTGNINILLRFTEDDAPPTAAEYYNTNTVGVQRSRSCPDDNGTYYYTANQGVANCYNATNDELVWSQAFESANVSIDTIYWTEQEVIGWTDATGVFSRATDVFGQDIVYYREGVAVSPGSPRQFRIFLEPTPGTNGKYDFAAWPTSYGLSKQGIRDADADNNLLLLDPWWNATGKSPNTGLNDGLVSFWPLENTTDIVGSNSLSVAGGSPTLETGKINDSYYYDGGNDECHVKSSPSGLNLQDFTVAAWVKYDSQGSGSSYTVSYGDVGGGGNYEGWALSMENVGYSHQFIVAEDGSNFAIAKGAAVNIGTWEFVVGRLNDTANEIELFVNGVSNGTASLTSAHYGSDDFKIGCSRSATAFVAEHEGNVDEVGFWNKALTDEEIADLYNNGTGLQYSEFGVVDEFRYAVNITVNSSEVDADLTDFPVYVNMSAVNFNWSNFQQADCVDLRVTNSTGGELPREIVSCDFALPYWIDPDDTEEFWFKANLQEGNNTFYIQKSTGTSPSGEDTFLWFDDASTDRMSEYTTAIGGKPTHTTDKYSWSQRATWSIYPTSITAENVSIKFDWAQTTPGSVDNRQIYLYARMNSDTTVYEGARFLIREGATGTDNVILRNDLGTLDDFNRDFAEDGTYYSSEFMIEDDNLTVYVDDVFQNSATTSKTPTTDFIGFGSYVFDGVMSMKNIVARGFTYNEPNITISDEGSFYKVVVDSPRELNNYSVLLNGTTINVSSSSESWLVKQEGKNGTGELHFKADFINSTSDTNFTIYYGSPTATDYAVTDTYGAQAVWSDYEAKYHYEEDARDSTSTGADGTTGGSVSLSSEGIVGKSYYYDAVSTGDVITYPDLDFSNDISLSSSFKVTGADDFALIFGQVDTTASDREMYIYLRSDTGQLVCQFYDADVDEHIVRTTSGLDDDVWHHVVCNYDKSAGSIQMFLNGVENDTGTPNDLVDDITVGINDGDQTWSTGKRHDGAINEMVGYIDEVGASNNVRSSAEVAAEYSSLFTNDVFLSSGSEVDLNESGPSINIGSFTIIDPDNTTYTDSTVGLNWSANLTTDYCAYVINGGTPNTSICDPSDTNVTFDLANGGYNIYITGNFTENGTTVTSDTIYFTVNAVTPGVATKCASIESWEFLSNLSLGTINMSSLEYSQADIVATNTSDCGYTYELDTTGASETTYTFTSNESYEGLVIEVDGQVVNVTEDVDIVVSAGQTQEINITGSYVLYDLLLGSPSFTLEVSAGAT